MMRRNTSPRGFEVCDPVRDGQYLSNKAGSNDRRYWARAVYAQMYPLTHLAGGTS
jgi:hypothetical protein